MLGDCLKIFLEQGKLMRKKCNEDAQGGFRFLGRTIGGPRREEEGKYKKRLKETFSESGKEREKSSLRLIQVGGFREVKTSYYR